MLLAFPRLDLSASITAHSHYHLDLIYSILFFPSSALKKFAVLAPLSWLTNLPSNGSFFNLSFVTLIPSVAHGLGFNFGQFTYYN